MAILYFDECAVAIMLVFVVSSIIKKEYRSRTNRIMLVMQILILISAFTDLTSGVMDNYAGPSRALQIFDYAVNYLYFAAHCMIIPVYILYVYSSAGIWHFFTAEKKNMIIWHLLLALNYSMLILNGFSINVFRISPDVKYVRGPWMAAFYGLAAVFGLWALYTLVHFRKFINKDKKLVLLVLYIVVIFGMLIQLVFDGVLVENFCITIALLFYIVMVRREEIQIDPVTGAFKYSEAINIINRNFHTNKPVSVILIKVRNYSNINLYLGQREFTLFLKMVSRRLNEISVECEYAAMVFYLERGIFALMGDDQEEENVRRVANAIHDEFATEVHVDNYSVVPDVRLCVVYCPSDISDFSTLLNLSSTFHHTLPDNRDVHFFKDFKDNRDFKIRNEMAEILSRAVEHSGFQMYYQPIYSIKKRKYIAAEALIRLFDKQYGFISPGMFIPLAEITGKIHDIGDFVLRDVIRFASTIDFENLGLEYIELNLSASQCIEVDLVNKIKGLLEEYGVDAEKISLELTEAATDINPEIVDDNIEKLHEFGVRIALDDYGTGYSNIKRVTALPIDQVKLDKSFVDLIDEPQMRIVIQDTIKMLREMGKEILVEGVENEEVARRFTEFQPDLIQGCELIQGFYFCKPLPADDFVEFMTEHNL